MDVMGANMLRRVWWAWEADHVDGADGDEEARDDDRGAELECEFEMSRHGIGDRASEVDTGSEGVLLRLSGDRCHVRAIRAGHNERYRLHGVGRRARCRECPQLGGAGRGSPGERVGGDGPQAHGR